MEGTPLGTGGVDITRPDQVAPRGRKASSTRKFKPQTSNPKMEETLERIAKCRFKTKMDKGSGFWQVDLTRAG